MVALATISKILQGNFDFQRDISLVTSDVISLNWFFQRWGVYKAGGQTPAIEFDNVLSVEFKKDWNIATYPVERGAFESYNKVQLPYECRVTFSSGGNYANRTALLKSVGQIAGDLKMYDIVTPEVTMFNANITHFDWRRAEGRSGLVVVTVWLQEVRNTVYAAFTSSQATLSESSGGTSTDPATNPSAATIESVGSVEATSILGSAEQDKVMREFGLTPSSTSIP